MSAKSEGFASEREKRAAELLSRAGYSVKTRIGPTDVPFDLGGYLPDMIARRGDEQLIVEVKSSVRHTSVERFREIAERVALEPGWRFVLVAADGEDEFLREALSWEQIRNHLRVAAKCESTGWDEAVFPSLWVAFEATLRRRAMAVKLAVESISFSALLRHLYSQGELSMGQFEKATGYLETANHVLHGFDVSGRNEVSRELADLVNTLVMEWAEP